MTFSFPSISNIPIRNSIYHVMLYIACAITIVRWLSFLQNCGKVDIIHNIIPTTPCSAERSFSVLQKLKTYRWITRDEDCVSHLSLLRIEGAYSNMINTEKVIDEFELRKAHTKFLFRPLFIYLAFCNKSFMKFFVHG